MSSRMLAGLLAAGCVTAAAGGAYVAVRQDAAVPAPVAAAAPAATPEPAAHPVAETEAVVGATPPPEPAPTVPAAPAHHQMREAPHAAPGPVVRREPAAPVVRRNPAPAAAPDREPVTASARPAVPVQPTSVQPPVASSVASPAEPVQEPSRVAEAPAAPSAPEFEEVVLPTSSVIGLEVSTPVSSERARVEDRVDARVTRDVMAAGRIAIPAGSRMIGAVTLVERGGKMKQAARLGVRFHTLVLADGREVPLSTEPVYRDGESPAADSARKIGGAAVGGAILGAIIGGGKGAIIGGATGAAGGSAVVMTGDRNAATLASGSVVTVRLSGPATIDVEKRDPQD
jgi:type IV secretory pathway VirB10-like protein